jgi:hypothetical protein
MRCKKDVERRFRVVWLALLVSTGVRCLRKSPVQGHCGLAKDVFALEDRHVDCLIVMTSRRDDGVARNLRMANLDAESSWIRR